MKRRIRYLSIAALAGLIFSIVSVRFAIAQATSNSVPFIGAQVFIEPGQTPQEIDHWFHILQQNGLKVARIRMFETYMHKSDGTWDYSLFDNAFQSAEKYNIKVIGTLFPATPFSDVGGFKFPQSEEHLKSIANYIQHVVTHFKKSNALLAWVLINEPGGGVPDTKYSTQKFNEWNAAHPDSAFNAKGYPIVNFDQERFQVYYNTWFLSWLAKEVHKYDPGRPLHVNPHAIFNNASQYDFPAWRKFLTTLGGSAHASWHFGYFNRDEYDVAMSANSEMIRSGAGPLPWLMTELQGGNNIYSGGVPMCPTKEEIAQWLWTIVGTGGIGAIFWTLNPRASGREAGEWALLNFQDQPSDRLQSTSEVAAVINKNSQLFAQAKVDESGISILYTRESMWTEEDSQTRGTYYEGRAVGGVMKSAIGYFETLSEMGIQSDFKEIGEYDFSGADYTGKTIILPHQVAIPAKYRADLENFVRNGGTLIVSGLTAFYDGHMHNVMQTNFPFESLFGGNIKEFKLVGNEFELHINNPYMTLPAHLWRGTIDSHGAVPIGTSNSEATAVINTFGKGKVVWVPSLLGIGARLKGDEPLASFLNEEATSSISNIDFRFQTWQEGMMLKTLKSGSSFITIVINKSNRIKNIELEMKKSLRPAVLFANKGGSALGRHIIISPEETMVIQWK